MRLTICAITYNEKEHLEHWHKQHKDLADEIYIVDTGSYDGTVEEAKRIGLRCETMKWTHDFAHAKNTAIRFATGDWVLLLSPDFWIHESNFKTIREVIHSKEIVGFRTPLFHHGKDWLNESYPEKVEIKRENWETDTHLVLFKNDPKIYFQHRVHENINESIDENYGEDRIGFIPVVRHHDNTTDQIHNFDKLKYYWALESYGAIERKFWEHTEVLRKQAYDTEIRQLSEQIRDTPRAKKKAVDRE